MYDLAHQNLGQAYARLGRVEDAEAAFERFRLLEPVGQRIAFLQQALLNSPGSVRVRIQRR